MTTSPYSLDLRRKVIVYLETGKSQISASQVFSINISTVRRWWVRYKKEGHYNPRKRLGKKPRILESSLKEYLSSNPNARAADIGKHFSMTYGGAFYWLKKLGYSYKKKRSTMWKLAK